MRELVLEFHTWRRMKSDDEHDPVVMFLFSLMPREKHSAGETPTHEEYFWTEASLSRELGESETWKHLSREQKTRILFHHAVESIRTAKRRLRQAPLFWTPGSGLDKGPPIDPEAVPFPTLAPVLIRIGVEEDTHRMARTGAGL